MTPITVFACESQPVMIEGLEHVFASQTDIVFAGARTSFGEGLEAVRNLAPTVVLVDQGVGLKPAMQFIADLKTIAPQTRPVLWTLDLAEVECFRVLQMGARGVLKKTMPVSALLECVRHVARGTVWMDGPSVNETSNGSRRRTAPRLTPRERDIVRCVCRGMKNKEIAESLAITAGTVKVHLMHIFEKAGVKDRFELAIHGRKLTGEEI